MFKALRIICCIISALILAACVFIFVYLEMLWGIISLVAAALFFGLTLLFKNLQEREEKKNTPPTEGDFITGRVKKDDNMNGDADNK